jgi:hypothetical protein
MIRSLDARVASAFGDDVSLDEVVALIVEVEDAAHAVSEAAERALERALDPALPANEIAEQRRAMDDAAFSRNYLSAVLPRLQQRLDELRAAEEDARCRAAYERVEAERDALAAELAELYPAFADKLADLLPRIDDNDREVAYVNNRLPSGCGLVAELIARGLEGFAQDGLDAPRIMSQLRLPAFKRCPSAPYAWPRSETERPNAMFSAIMALANSKRSAA